MTYHLAEQWRSCLLLPDKLSLDYILLWLLLQAESESG
jgi:hypothetical protein